MVVLMSEHDTTRLQDLGKRRQKLIEQLAALDRDLEPEIYAAAQAGIQQVDIIRWTGLARESVRVKSLSPEQRQTLKERRRKAPAN
jgi:hypothetical protein